MAPTRIGNARGQTGDRPARVGVVGCGTQGRVHLRALRRLGPERAAVAGLCDLDAARLREVGDEWPQARLSRDFAGLLALGDLDLVILCTMPNTHARIAVAALQAGANVLVEKPLAMNAVEAETILDAAAQAGRQVQLGTNMRYLPWARHLRRAFVSGRVGEALECRVWLSHLDPPLWGPHYIRAVSGGGVLASTVIHNLDLALWVCGYPQAVTVSASARRVFPAKRGPLASDEVRQRYDAEDLFSAYIRFASGLVMQVEGNWCDDTGDRSGFELIGSLGTLRSSPPEVLYEDEGGRVRREAAGPMDEPSKEGEDRPPGDWHGSVGAQDAEVIGHLREGTAWTMQDRRQLLGLQRLVDACYEAARTGREVVF